jgi:hypothetical protein
MFSLVSRNKVYGFEEILELRRGEELGEGVES